MRFSIIAFALLVATVCQQTPAYPAAKKSSGESTNATSIAQEKKQVVIPPATSVDKCDGRSSENKPTHHSEEAITYDPRNDLLYRRYLWFTIIGVIGGIFGLGILIVQSALLRSSVKAAHKSADALMDSETAFVSIKADKVILTHEMGKTYVTYPLANIGRTVAFIFSGESLLQLGPDSMAPPDPSLYGWLGDNLPADFLLPGNGSSNSMTFLSIPGEPAPGTTKEPFTAKRVSSDEQLKIQSRLLTLWSYGFVRYRDIFGRKYEMRFCHRLEPMLAPQPGFIVAGPSEFNRLTRYTEKT